MERQSFFSLVDLLLDVSIELLPGDALGIEACHIVDDLADILIDDIELQLIADTLQIIEVQQFLAFRVDKREDCTTAILIVGVALRSDYEVP